MSNFREFIEQYSERVGGLPSQKDFPDFGPPPGPPPSITKMLDTQDDIELSRNLDKWLAWKTFAEESVGKYAALEEAMKQELAKVKRKVYLDYDRGGEFKSRTVDHKNALVESHPDVEDAASMLSEIRQNLLTTKEHKSSYEGMVIRYSLERKLRRNERHPEFSGG